MQTLLRILRQIGLWIVALVILFEEWGWEPLARALARLGRLPFFAWLERRISALPPYAALALFLVPAAALLPVKLLALYWVGEGHVVMGMAVILAAKVGGTALVARLFMLTRDSLMRLGWFARLYARWERWKNRLEAMVRASPAWQRLQARVAAMKQWMRQAWQRLRGLR
jgi:hypothetical protein